MGAVGLEADEALPQKDKSLLQADGGAAGAAAAAACVPPSCRAELATPAGPAEGDHLGGLQATKFPSRSRAF